MKCDLLFIATFIDLKMVEGFLSSLQFNRCIGLQVVLVAQNNIEIDISNYQSQYNLITVLRVSEQLSLSKARNVGIEYINVNNITSDYVMFPDDDSSFSVEFFENFKALVSCNTLIDVYCRGSKELFKPTSYKSGDILGRWQYQASMSVNMIVDRNTFSTVGCFDENMGVGATYGAGEDGDYFIRCCNASGRGFKYEKGLWNFHPKGIDKYKHMSLAQLNRRYRNYGRGVIYLLCKHDMKLAAVRCCFDALAGSLVALFKLEFKLSCARLYAFIVRSSTLIQYKKI